MAISTDALLRQHDVERMAREAVKVYGITTALDAAILESKGTDPADFSGAFDAVEDIAQALAADLAALAERTEA